MAPARGLVWILVVTTIISATASSTANAAAASSKKKPNIVFLVCESTDGRTWRKGYQNNVIPLPNLRQLEQAPGGTSFHRHYANSPVCCPSRATFWSGRHTHKIPHVQHLAHTDDTTGQKRIKELPVDGVWNNFEGLPRDFDQRIDQILQQQGGYETYLSGKRDWATGGHSLNVRLSAWTMYTRFPYNTPATGGWRSELLDICANNGTVLPGNQSAHWDDWKTLNETVQWMKDFSRNKAIHNNQTSAANNKPFFVYQGMNIVHPPYSTNEYYYNKIDPQKITIPEWPPLEELHPCDLQSSMMKGCIPALNNASAMDWYYSKERRRNIRRIYYAMIAEFDAMVGAYMQAVKEIGEWENTIFVVTSDHGDQQMEHQQSYKMVPYDASSSVPLIIMDGRVQQRGNEKDNNTHRRVIDAPTQLIDLYPTVMDLAGVSPSDYPKDLLDGHSLVPFMSTAAAGHQKYGSTNGNEEKVRDHKKEEGSTTLTKTTRSSRPDFVVSQFHGMEIAMSWFLIVRPMACVTKYNSGGNDDTRRTEMLPKNTHVFRSLSNSANSTSAPTMCTMKLVIWGTGNEVDSQLFDLSNDPDEMINLIHHSSYASTIQSLEQDLRSVVDYPRVAFAVADYNRQSMKNWIEVMGEPLWRHVIHSNLRWDESWNYDSDGAFAALEEWVNGTRTEILPCRSELVWPPPASSSQLQ
jgi:arylsulfatase A-like enzyme